MLNDDRLLTANQFKRKEKMAGDGRNLWAITISAGAKGLIGIVPPH
jgi:hypothetical protein